MEAKFEKGQRARVTKKNGKVVEGTIRDWGYNPCTFEREYSLDYMKKGKRRNKHRGYRVANSRAQ
mgnify:CR=1 FL=1